MQDLTKYFYFGNKKGTPNKITQLIYQAKFFGKQHAIFILANLLYNVIQNYKIDYIIYVEPTTNLFHVPRKLAALVSVKKGCFYFSELAIDSMIQDKTILILDDVITTGATVIRVAEKAKQYKPKQIYVIACAKSPNFNPLTIKNE